MTRASRKGNEPPIKRSVHRALITKRPRENSHLDELVSTASGAKRPKNIDSEKDTVEQIEANAQLSKRSAFSEDEVAQAGKVLTKVVMRDKDREYKSGIDESLPPISDISEIFAEMTNTALDHGLLNAINHLEGKALRVATVCSGTESPILALTEICARKLVSLIVAWSMANALKT